MGKYYIVLRAILTTLRISLETLFDYYTRGVKREVQDRRFRRYGNTLLDTLDASYSVHYEKKFELEKGRRYIIMCNHSSHYDIPLTAAALPYSIRMMAKKELFKVPFWGSAMKASEFLSIDRDNKKQALKDLKKAKKILENGIVLWISPEGTRSKDGKLGPFKKGGFRVALDMQATIIPVGIKGSHEILPTKSLNFKKGVHAEIRVGTPVDASQYDRSTREDLIKEVESQIRNLTGQ